MEIPIPSPEQIAAVEKANEERKKMCEELLIEIKEREKNKKKTKSK